MSEKVELARGFEKIYETEWKGARASLRKHKHDEEIVYLLMRIARTAFDFCLDDNHSSSIQDSVKEFIHQQPHGLPNKEITPEVRVFIRKCVDYLQKMCSSKYRMSIAWVPKGDVIDRDVYNVEGGPEAHVCDWTVWPAVIDSDGSILAKGVVIPIK